tara:strand:- start:2227 stop:2529 length:303 start_codon:yes stop_codon:yes gene_type:complete
MSKQHDKKVYIFTLKACPGCKMLCKWLRSIKFEFEELDIKEEVDLWERAKIEGEMSGEAFDTVPTFMIVDKNGFRYYSNQPRDWNTPRDGLDSIQGYLAM